MDGPNQVGIWKTASDDTRQGEATQKALAKISVACFVLKKLAVADAEDTPNRKKVAVIDANNTPDKGDAVESLAVQPLKSLEEIGRRLIEVLRVRIPTADLAELMVRWPASAVEKSQGASKTPQTKRLEFLEYNSEGKVVNITASFRAKGLTSAALSRSEASLRRGPSRHFKMVACRR